MFRKILIYGFYTLYYPLSFVWRWFDKKTSWRETRFWIDHIPNASFTPATYSSYAGWIVNQGFFCALFSLYLKKPNPKIFDFGCGMGNQAPICHHFIKNGGSFLGVDTDRTSIEAAKKTHADLPNCSFYLTKDSNPYYPQGDQTQPMQDGIDWPIKPKSQDMLISVSVFTHLQQKDAERYMDKVYEVLADDGHAIITFHIVRDYVNENETYNFTHQLTPGWFTSNPSCPEKAIGVTTEAHRSLLAGRFEILAHIEGSVTGGKHPYLQDLFVLKKIPGK